MKRRPGRKLLAASVGVAAVSYVVVACRTEPPQVTGNLMAPVEPTTAPSRPPPPEPPVGNLMPPEEPNEPIEPIRPDAGADAGRLHKPFPEPPVGNLMPPPPPPKR